MSRHGETDGQSKSKLYTKRKISILFYSTRPLFFYLRTLFSIHIFLRATTHVRLGDRPRAAGAHGLAHLWPHQGSAAIETQEES